MVKTVRANKPAINLVQLRIELSDVTPAVWRSVVVPEDITLTKLHSVIQIAMGWAFAHMHQFYIAGKIYGIADPDDEYSSVISQARKSLNKVLEGEAVFRYVYDFGDDWDHWITVERSLPADAYPQTPWCIGGANACPLEDIGGAVGHADYIAAISDPSHPQHEAMLEWVGDDYNPAEFDLALTNEWLEETRR
jgi:hypothetical protein